MHRKHLVEPAVAPPATGGRMPTIRPSLPVLSWVAAALAGGIFFAEEAAWRSMTEVRGSFAVATVLIVLVAGWRGTTQIARTWRHRDATFAFADLILAAFVSGALLGGAWCARWESNRRDLEGVRVSAWTVEALSDPVTGRFGASSRVRLIPVAGQVTPQDIVVAQWPSEQGPPEAGSLVRCSGSLRTLQPSQDPRAREYMRDNIGGSLKVRRIVSIGRARSARGLLAPVRAWARRRTGRVEGEGGALLDGIVLGDRRRLAETVAERDFKVAGLTHLVAVSGSHLVVVAACVAGFVGLFGVRRAWSAVLAVGICGVYVVFSGVQVSAVRAWIMTLVALAPLLMGRRTDALAALALTVVVMLVISPWALFDIGFQLSVLSVLGLLVLARLANSWLEVALPRRLHALGAALSMSLVAQSATIPITSRVFGQVSLIAPLANLVIGPIVSVSLVVGLAGLGVSAALPRAGEAVLGSAGNVLGAGAQIAHALASLPNAAIPASQTLIWFATLGVGALACVWVAWPRPTSRRNARILLLVLAAISVVLATGPRLSDEPILSVLDVGQGDAVLVRDGSAAVLIDTGPSGTAMRAAIARTGVRRLDAVVLTHAHEDHTGGLDGLREVVRIEQVYRATSEARGSRHGTAIANGSNDPAGASRSPGLSVGDTLTCGRWTLTVLWPTHANRTYDSANDESVVLLAQCGDFEALLTGDAESSVLGELDKAGSLTDVDVLKVGHHGSKEAVNYATLKALSPEIAVVSVGEGNRFGHPAQATLDLLSACGARTIRTDEAGDATFAVKGANTTVETAR